MFLEKYENNQCIKCTVIMPEMLYSVHISDKGVIVVLSGINFKARGGFSHVLS